MEKKLLSSIVKIKRDEERKKKKNLSKREEESEKKREEEKGEWNELPFLCCFFYPFLLLKWWGWTPKTPF